MEFIEQLNKEILKRKVKSIQGIIKLRDGLAKKLHPKELPSLVTIFAKADKKQKLYLRKILRTKPGRTLSGVSPVAVMTKPIKCPPQAKCIYCPGGIKSQFGDTPQSYTGNEPASMRARRNLYDSYLQVFNRLEHYILLNQDISKCEVIVMGGTFTSFSKRYCEEFVKYIYKAMNDFSKLFFKKKEFDYDKFSKFFELDKEFRDPERIKKIISKLKKLKGKCELKKEQLKNEKSNCRVIGLTLETRPDCVNLDIGNFMLKLGATRVELGIQSTDDKVLKFVKRGHGTKESKNAIKLLKDLGFKINLHYMIFHKKENMKELFSDEDYRPDMLKIYPCMIFKGTKLYELFKKGKYKQITTKDAAEIISNFKKYIPSFCRVQRIQRDIPPKLSEGGVNKSNLRQYVDELCKKKGIKCRCIRCREVDRVLSKDNNIRIGEIQFKINHYKASDGDEFFISAEDFDNDIIFGYCRLRFPSQFLRKEITKDSAIVRELHIYSTALPIGKVSKDSFQHRGIGRKLLKMAEDIALENNKNKMLIISGVGVREYFRKFGYERENTYMVKPLIN